MSKSNWFCNTVEARHTVTSLLPSLYSGPNKSLASHFLRLPQNTARFLWPVGDRIDADHEAPLHYATIFWSVVNWIREVDEAPLYYAKQCLDVQNSCHCFIQSEVKPKQIAINSLTCTRCPRFESVTCACIYCKCWLVHWIVCVYFNWLEWFLLYGFKTLSWKPL